MPHSFAACRKDLPFLIALRARTTSSSEYFGMMIVSIDIPKIKKIDKRIR
jgi:hypothetical protein